MIDMRKEQMGEGKERKSIQKLWEESDRITQEILSHPWKYPFQYLIMRLGRFPDKSESK